MNTSISITVSVADLLPNELRRAVIPEVSLLLLLMTSGLSHYSPHCGIISNYPDWSAIGYLSIKLVWEGGYIGKDPRFHCYLQNVMSLKKIVL